MCAALTGMCVRDRLPWRPSLVNATRQQVGCGYREEHHSMVKVIATIQRTETRELIVEGDTYPEARATVQDQLPEGYRVMSILVQR